MGHNDTIHDLTYPGLAYDLTTSSTDPKENDMQETDTRWYGETDMQNIDQLRWAFGCATEAPPFSEVESVERMWIVSPEGGGSVDLAAIGAFKDGRWFAIEAWADYTGWGCQDGADVVVRDLRDDVILHGLTEEARGHLELPKLGASS